MCLWLPIRQVEFWSGFVKLRGLVNGKGSDGQKVRRSDGTRNKPLHVRMDWEEWVDTQSDKVMERASESKE